MEPDNASDAESLVAPELKAQSDPRTFSTKETADGAEVLSISDRVKTVDDAIRKGEFDLAVWYVHASECTSWECCLKNADGKPEVVPLWRIKLSLRRHAERATRSRRSFRSPTRTRPGVSLARARAVDGRSAHGRTVAHGRSLRQARLAA